MAILAENKKAKYNYEILERYEAGLELTGQEVKALRQRGVSLYGNYIAIKRKKNGSPEIFWVGANIPPYQPQNAGSSYVPQRDRKLLLHKKEINELNVKIKERGLTLIPLLVYTKNHRLKMEIGLAKGKKAFDKREAIKKRETERKIQNTLKTRG
ncbi:MAG TPA: SsrA-binding protein SmpB [Candidatus Pacearchaeota archaeon]|jgi:SsrA-binding protein|nr:SsrA-binding protein SmpB [Candidatus Pacearchaeota archaeon]HRR94630.1 SsrA-binding protein SmpB [Candidatus Paceibacterota bacterium]HPC30336.1 SsrA-binding protein SmpB [Candidatus Pacearchaeota archaeon]HQG09026.1 SsrA-binding protein SmpB [Candidatus Pacearchaeota archaeon]HQH20007.1 SsrA-binding protein SmpB [Candidatus Pacearchaeota archaeon]